MSDASPSLLWYDLETFGADPKWDRVAQFAAVRTDADFRPVEDPVVAYCRVTPDYIPHPEACLVSGLTPRRVAETGIRETELAGIIHDSMSRPATCTVGYNNLRFDDEFVRHVFYRNFLDPYAREYEHHNSRWDIIDLMRMCHDLRPEGIEWVHNEAGRPSFKLELLTEANGIVHEHAHDALSDVHATIALAARAREHQPKLFEFYFRMRNKGAVRRFLNLQHPEPLLHTSFVHTSDLGCTTIVYPVSVHPNQTNAIIVYDLRHDPDDWLDADAAELRRRVFSSAAEMEPERRVRLLTVHVNRSPALAPLNVLPEERAVRLGLDMDRCRANAEKLASRPDLVTRVRDVYREREFPTYKDPELQLYSGGFFDDEDRERFDAVRAADPKTLILDPPTFNDPRAAQLLRRYLARNYYDLLPKAEKDRWKSFCASRLLAPEPESALDFGRFRRYVDSHLARVDTPAAHKRVLAELLEYARWLETHILS